MKSTKLYFLNTIKRPIHRNNSRQKRQLMKDPEDSGGAAVMYIPISSSSSSECPIGSNSVADASVTGISQVKKPFLAN